MCSYSYPVHKTFQSYPVHKTFQDELTQDNSQEIYRPPHFNSTNINYKNFPKINRNMVYQVDNIYRKKKNGELYIVDPLYFRASTEFFEIIDDMVKYCEDVLLETCSDNYYVICPTLYYKNMTNMGFFLARQRKDQNFDETINSKLTELFNCQASFKVSSFGYRTFKSNSNCVMSGVIIDADDLIKNDNNKLKPNNKMYTDSFVAIMIITKDPQRFLNRFKLNDNKCIASLTAISTYTLNRITPILTSWIKNANSNNKFTYPFCKYGTEKCRYGNGCRYLHIR